MKVRALFHVFLLAVGFLHSGMRATAFAAHQPTVLDENANRSDVSPLAVTGMQNVAWTNLVNTTLSGTSLKKTGGCDGCSGAGAISSQRISSAGGDFQFTAGSGNTLWYGGLSNATTTSGIPQNIGYAFAVYGSYFEIREKGQYRTDRRYSASDVLRISVSNNQVRYYQNGTLIYTSSVPPTFPLGADAAILGMNNTITNGLITASSASDTTPPLFAGITIGTPTSSGVTISWTTNEPANRQVEYGTTTAYGSSSPLDTRLDTAHTVTLSGLAARTTYNFRLRSRDAAGNLGLTKNLTFTTAAPPSDTTPPTLSGITAGGITTGGATIAWTTNEPADRQVEYGATTAYGASSPVGTSLATSHSVSLSGLAAGTTYNYRVRSRDAAGNTAVSGNFTFTTAAGAPPSDTAPPVVSGVTVGSVSSSGATISWTTNEAADRQIEYGTTSAYGLFTTIGTPLATTHGVSLSGLAPGTTYNFRARSRDAAGNLGVSGNFTFTTGSAATPPQAVITDRNVYPEPALPALPAAGGTFTDPVFGTTIMRLTDAGDGTVNNVQYSYWPSFNRTSTRIMITTGNLGGTLYDFDPVNFRMSGKRALYQSRCPDGETASVEDAIWSGLDPDVIFTHTSMRIWAYNVATNTWTLVKNFTGILPNSFLWQMSRSNDDNVFAFTRKDGSTYGVQGYIAWRKDTDGLYRSDTTSLDEVQVDKSGQWLTVKTGNQGAGAIEVRIVNLLTGAVENLTDNGPDFAPGHSDNGAATVVGVDNWNNQITFRALGSPHQFRTVVGFGNDWSMDLHVSNLADNENWALISTFKGTGNGVFRREIFQAATDGSGRVRRLAHNRSIYQQYWDSPRANISRDGRFVIFNSNWGGTGRSDVFILNLSRIVAP